MSSKSIKTEKDLIEALKDKSPFEIDVYVATYRIPEGKVSTYKRIAEKIGKPKAYRAVGNALHKNPLSPIVPCHRVVASDGSLSGDKKGDKRRRAILKKEGVHLENGRLLLSKEILC